MKILIVDDSAVKISEVKSLLDSVGANGHCNVDVANCGLRARELLSRIQYDLLILDIKLPLREGDEPDRKGGMNLLTEITLGERFLRPTHVVALTGFEDLRKEFESKYNNGQWTIETYDPADLGWRERLRAKAVYIYKSLRQAGADYGVDLCVIVALTSPELDAIRSLPWHWGQAEALDPVSFFYRGKFLSGEKEFSVVASAASRMGMVSSATLTQKLIHHHRPRILAMTGICAGIKGACELGDILVADPCWDWQMGKYAQEAFEIAPDQISAPLEITQRLNLLKEERKLFIDLSEAFKSEKPDRIPQLLVGPTASGSAVLADEATVDLIKKQHRKSLGVDMEMYGVYSSSRDSGAPRPMTIGLKAVCDFADHLKNDKYQKFAAYMSAQVLRVFVERNANEIISKQALRRVA